MITDKFHLIQKLIEDELSKEERNRLIAEIKESEEMKFEFALMMKIKEESKKKLKQELLNRLRAGEELDETAVGPAAAALMQIKAAAFSANKPDNTEDLPIDEETIEDFLNSEEESETKEE